MPRKNVRKKRFRFFRWVIRILVLLLLAAAGLVLYGIPGSWLAAVVNGTDQFPGRIELSEIRWQPGHGWHMEEVNWFSPRDLTRPLVQANGITVHLPNRSHPARVRIEEGSVKTDAGVWMGDLTTRHLIHLTGVSGEVQWDHNRVSLLNVQGSISGLRIFVEGELEIGNHVVGGPRGGLQDLIGKVLRPAVPVLKGLEAFSSSSPPELHVQLSGSMQNPGIQMQCFQPEPFQLRGVSFESFRLSGTLEDRSLHFNEFEIKTANGRSLTASSQIHFREQMFDVELNNTLARDAVEALSPFSLDAFLAKLELRAEGQADFSLKIGPSSFRKPGQKVSGSFRIEDGSYRDAFFPEAVFDLELNHSHLLLPHFSGTIGAGRGAGEVSGNLELDWKRGIFRMEVAGAADPDLAVSLVGPQTESLIREWEFRGKPPEFKLGVNQPNRETAMEVNLIIRAQQAVWRGTLFHQVRALATLDEESLRVREVLATRGPHLLEGSFTFPRSLQSCTYTLESSFPLPDILPLLGQTAMDVIRPVQFLGDTRFSSSGFVDLSGEHRHDLSGQAEFDRAVVDWVFFDKLNAPFVLKGQQLDIPDIEATLVEGGLKGEIRLSALFEPTASFYTKLDVWDVDLFELITKATDRPATPYTGTMDLDLQLEGMLWNTVEVQNVSTFQGKGKIEIREGELFRIPLLLGLSNILSTVTKGFGYASQGDFDADFVVEDGRISSENIFLGGSVMSIAGTFAYDLDSQGLDGNVKVQLLKDGLMSDALKVLLWPIRKLIEVSLTGTLDEPDWRPRNLPKELFGK